MIIPNQSVFAPAGAMQRRVDGAGQYEGNDMGGNFYRRQRKPKEAPKDEKPKSGPKNPGHIDIVA